MPPNPKKGSKPSAPTSTSASNTSASATISARDRRSVSRQSTPLSALDSTPSTPRTGTPTSASAVATVNPTMGTGAGHASSTNTASVGAPVGAPVGGSTALSGAKSMPTPAVVGKETPYTHTPTTSLLPPIATPQTTEGQTLAQTQSQQTQTLTTLLDKSNASTPTKLDPPPARELHSLHNRIRDGVAKSMAKRGEVCERGIRVLAQRRKERLVLEREAEVSAARAEEERVEREREVEEGRKRKRRKGETKKAEAEADVEGEGDAMQGVEGEREAEIEAEKEREELREILPSVGAHGLARQDGVGVNQGPPAPPSPIITPGQPTLDPMDIQPASPTTSTSPTTPSSPTSAPAGKSTTSTAPLYERAFGKDPTQTSDPTIYAILPLSPTLTHDATREILNVAHWPEQTDLGDLTAGDPPDEDFSNAKPANQVHFSTFQTYVEPFIRPFTEEDVAFLKERGDRVTPFLIPARGTRGYREVWAQEEGLDGVLAPRRRDERDPNEARGGMEEMCDEISETDEVSLGPVMERLLSVIRPVVSSFTGGGRKDTANASAAGVGTGSGSGSAGVGGGDDADAMDTITLSNGELDPSAAVEPPQALPGADDAPTTSLTNNYNKPLTALPPDAPRPTQLHSLDYPALETRALQELRHIGLLPPGGISAATSGPSPDFSAQNDDEVAARLRTLQCELRSTARRNNVRKLRVLELAEERMAMQEYSGIADDLDGQVNAAYLKRNRSLGKPGSKKGGGSAVSAAGANRAAGGGHKGLAGLVGVGGQGRGVSDGVRALMGKRRDWIEMVGPVVGFGRPPIPGDGETVFASEAVGVWESVEREAEMGEGEGE